MVMAVDIIHGEALSWNKKKIQFKMYFNFIDHILICDIFNLMLTGFVEFSSH